jgi:hypothetical protein
MPIDNESYSTSEMRISLMLWQLSFEINVQIGAKDRSAGVSGVQCLMYHPAIELQPAQLPVEIILWVAQINVWFP